MSCYRKAPIQIKVSYGLGIDVGDAKGVPSFSHGGSNMGFRAMLYAMSKAGQGAVVMTNGDGGDTLAGDILRSIAAEYTWEGWRIAEKPVAPVGAKILAQYAGSYQLDAMKIAVMQNGERLFVAAPPLGPQPVEMFPSSETDFFILVDDIEFGFEANQAGKFDMIIKGEKPKKAARIL